MNDFEAYAAHVKKRISQKMSKTFKKSTPKERIAEKMARKADPGWDNADRPSRTKGHKVYEENK